MDTTTLMGPAEVRDLLLDVIARHPDNVNPFEEDGLNCAYTDPKDPERHCLIGQLVAEQGWAMPSPEHNANAAFVAGTHHWPLTADAADWIGDAQEAADNASNAGAPWSAIELPGLPA